MSVASLPLYIHVKHKKTKNAKIPCGTRVSDVGPSWSSCLHDKVYIFGRIFMKLTQFVSLINSLNPIDFEKKKKIRHSVG